MSLVAGLTASVLLSCAVIRLWTWSKALISG